MKLIVSLKGIKLTCSFSCLSTFYSQHPVRKYTSNMWNTSSSSSSSSDPKLKDLYPLPPKYKIKKLLGQGSFGVVLKCMDRLTKETVALKISKDFRNLNDEVGHFVRMTVFCVETKTIGLQLSI